MDKKISAKSAKNTTTKAPKTVKKAGKKAAQTPKAKTGKISAAKKRDTQLHKTAVQPQKTTPIVETPIAETGIVKNFFGVYQKYFKFGGRASRYEYFSFSLIYFLLTLLFQLFYPVASVFFIINEIFMVLSIIPILALINRRLHDIGHNLWNGLFNLPVYGILAVLGITITGGMLNKWINPQDYFFLLATLVIIFICLSAAAIRLLIYVCRRGQTNENKYGPAPLLNAPETEKSAFRIIVTYFTIVIVTYLLSAVFLYFSIMEAKQRISKTEAQLAYAEAQIHDIAFYEKNYAWLNNDVVIRQPLVPEDMINEDKTALITALGLPVNFYGFNDIFVISLQGINTEMCEQITTSPWRFHNLDEMMIRNPKHLPPIQETLVKREQCGVCAQSPCEIFWKIK